MEGCGGNHERTEFQQIVFWEGVVVSKELIVNNFNFGMAWCGDHVRTDF